MAVLKVKTIGAVGDTPVARFAGTVETMVGLVCACTQVKHARKAMRDGNRFESGKYL